MEKNRTRNDLYNLPVCSHVLSVNNLIHRSVACTVYVMYGEIEFMLTQELHHPRLDGLDLGCLINVCTSCKHLFGLASR